MSNTNESSTLPRRSSVNCGYGDHCTLEMSAETASVSTQRRGSVVELNYSTGLLDNIKEGEVQREVPKSRSCDLSAQPEAKALSMLVREQDTGSPISSIQIKEDTSSSEDNDIENDIDNEGESEGTTPTSTGSGVQAQSRIAQLAAASAQESLAAARRISGRVSFLDFLKEDSEGESDESEEETKTPEDTPTPTKSRWGSPWGNSSNNSSGNSDPIAVKKKGSGLLGKLTEPSALKKLFSTSPTTASSSTTSPQQGSHDRRLSLLFPKSPIRLRTNSDTALRVQPKYRALYGQYAHYTTMPVSEVVAIERKRKDESGRFSPMAILTSIHYEEHRKITA